MPESENQNRLQQLGTVLGFGRSFLPWSGGYEGPLSPGQKPPSPFDQTAGLPDGMRLGHGVGQELGNLAWIWAGETAIGQSATSTGSANAALDGVSSKSGALGDGSGSRAGAAGSEATAAGGDLGQARQSLANVLHQRELGLDPAKGGKFSLDEAGTGTRLESQIGTRLSRDLSGDGDWVSAGGKVFDAASPPPSNFFNDATFSQWQNSIQSHLNKDGVDVIVVDVVQRGLSPQQADRVSRYIESLPSGQQSRIVILK